MNFLASSTFIAIPLYFSLFLSIPLYVIPRHCGSNVNMRCQGQQGRGFSSLPQPIKRHEALKNDVENGGVKNASDKCCIIVQSAITFVVILGWHTPQDVPIPSIHNAIAAAMSMCVAEGNKVVDSPVCLSL